MKHLIKRFVFQVAVALVTLSLVANSAEAQIPCTSRCSDCEWLGTNTFDDGFPRNSPRALTFECVWTSCGQCEPEFAAVTDELIKLVDAKDLHGLASWLVRQPSGQLNAARASIQLTGCDGISIIANVPLGREFSQQVAYAADAYARRVKALLLLSNAYAVE